MWNLKLQQELQAKLDSVKAEIEKEGLVIYDNKVTYPDQFRYFATLCFYFNKNDNPLANMVEITSTVFHNYMAQANISIDTLVSSIFKSGVPYRDGDVFKVQDLDICKNINISEEVFIDGIKTTKITNDTLDITFNIAGLIEGTINLVKQRKLIIDRKLVDFID